MKPATSRQKPARNSKRIPDREAAVVPNGQAITPPAYGIDAVDNQVIQAQAESAQASENRTGLPDKLKAGIEALSGLSMDDVRVHYNSPQPAQLQALAYTQGTDIHVGPGQEKHLAHEAWHVVQQKQGRVRPTANVMGTAINDEPKLEREAHVLGNTVSRGGKPARSIRKPLRMSRHSNVVQRYVGLFEQGEGLYESPWSINSRGDLLMSSPRYPHLTIDLTHLNRYLVNDAPTIGLSFEKFHYSASKDDPNRVGFKETSDDKWQPENKGQNYQAAKTKAGDLMRIIGANLSDEIIQLDWRRK